MANEKGKELGDKTGIFSEGITLSDVVGKLDVKNKGLQEVGGAVLRT